MDSMQQIINAYLINRIHDLTESVCKSNILVRRILKDRAIERIKQQPFFGVMK